MTAPAGHPAEPRDDYEEAGCFPIVIEGRQYRVPLHCPHRAGRLDHGHVNERRRTVTCPLHHSTFSLDTGEQLAGPDCGALGVSILAGEASETMMEAGGRQLLREDNADAVR